MLKGTDLKGSNINTFRCDIELNTTYISNKIEYNLNIDTGKTHLLLHWSIRIDEPKEK
jgi:hypothetical protein